MSDPLSVAASVAGLISLGITVSQSLVDLYNSYKDLDSDLTGTMKNLESLLDIFRCLEGMISNRKFQADERGLVKTIEASISKCDKLIRKLQDEWNKFSSDTSSDKFIAAVKRVGHRATYPFQKGTLQKMDEAIYKIRHILSFALGVLQLKDNKRIQTDVAEIKTLLDLDKANQISSNVRDWLKAPDATIDHNAACSKRHPDTGSWLIEDTRFLKWFIEEDSILWLNGFAGSGKSVLCSTVIESVLSLRGSDPRIGIAFFYFTFTDESKQDVMGMLRALLLQLSSQLQDGHADLVPLYNSYKTGTPPLEVLMTHLQLLIERFGHVYIMLDALDECPRVRLREHVQVHVLNALVTMGEWALQRLHLFVTSRDERDIRELFDSDLPTTQKVAMRDSGIDRDIANFISGRLDTNRTLRKWKKHRDTIQETLATRAKGMFRWVECQLVSLEDCPPNPSALHDLLNSLPDSLDETYERMLCKIGPRSIEYARRILTLLCFASRPLTLRELIDGIAVSTTEPIGLDEKRRFKGGYNDINDICPGLTSLTIDAYQTPIVQIAHFSVQEYLESDRMQHQKAKHFGLTSVKAHAEISQICLIYLLEPNLSSPEPKQGIIEEYPLAKFAARYWHVHYKSMAHPASILDTLILRLFQQKESFMTWINLHDVDNPLGYERIISPLPTYYASLLGLDQPLHEVLNTKQQEDINAPGGRRGTSLQAASSEGHEKVVQLLLDEGADINAQIENLGNALYIASSEGHKNVVQLLLNEGADINAPGGRRGNALQAASYKGHEKVVQLLLDKGADINAQGGYFGNALQAASYKGHEKVVQLLLDKGADINAQGGDFYNALHAASYGGHEKMVQLLLDKGADINAQSEHFGNALQAASYNDNEKMVQLLIDRGADVNAQCGRFGNALQQASFWGSNKVIQLLLDRGADVNAQGGKYGNALTAASYEQCFDAVHLLIDAGADFNAPMRGWDGKRHRNALAAALYRGNHGMAQLLRYRGAVLEMEESSDEDSPVEDSPVKDSPIEDRPVEDNSDYYTPDED